MKKRTFKIFIQSQNNSSQEYLQMTIKQHNLRDRKRLRTIEDQSEEIILQNNDIDDELTSNQKGLLFEEQCQEILRSQGISCTLSSASRWQQKNRELHKKPRKYVKRISKHNQPFELLIQGDHGIDAYGYSKARQYIAQFKNHNGPIGPGMVRDFIGTLSAYENTIGIFISKNGFTANAICEFESSRQPIIYDTQIPINIKEIMLETKPIVLLQTSIKADTFEGSLLNGLIDVRQATNLLIQTQSTARY